VVYVWRGALNFVIDPTRLTFRYQGRDFRLTDAHGNVVREILA